MGTESYITQQIWIPCMHARTCACVCVRPSVHTFIQNTAHYIPSNMPDTHLQVPWAKSQWY